MKLNDSGNLFICLVVHSFIHQSQNRTERQVLSFEIIEHLTNMVRIRVIVRVRIRVIVRVTVRVRVDRTNRKSF